MPDCALAAARSASYLCHQTCGLACSPYVIERLLNHRLGTIQFGDEISAVAAVYNRHQYLDEMREAIEKWETQLTLLLATSAIASETRAA
jgi:hypothetical protein